MLELLTRVGVELPPLEPAGIAKALKVAREKIGFDELVVHTPDFAAASSASDGEAFALQEKQTNVVRLAGAGDSFNASNTGSNPFPVNSRMSSTIRKLSLYITRGPAPTW